MGYSVKTVKPSTTTDPGWHIVRAGFPLNGTEQKVAYFGQRKDILRERAEAWLAANDPNTQHQLTEETRQQ